MQQAIKYNKELLKQRLNSFNQEINNTFNVALKHYLQDLRNINSDETALEILKNAVLDNTNIDRIIKQYNTYYQNLQTLKQEEYLNDFNNPAELKESYNAIKKKFEDEEKKVLETRQKLIKQKIQEDLKKNQEQLNKQQKEENRANEEMEKLPNLNDIFTQRVGRGFFKLFGGGKPSLQSILAEIGLTDIKSIKSIDQAKPKLIAKFGDANTAELAFKAACENKFYATTFDEMKNRNNKNSELSDLCQEAINEKNKFEQENKEMKAQIEDYKNAFNDIEKLPDVDQHDYKSNISQILSAIKNIYQAKRQGDEEAKEVQDLMDKFNKNIAVLEKAVQEERNKQDNDLKEKLHARSKQKKNVFTAPQVQDDNLQSRSLSSGSNRSQAQGQNNIYQNTQQRSSSRELGNGANFKSLVENKRNSQLSQGSVR